MANLLTKIISVLPESQRIAIKGLISAKASSGELVSLRAKQEEASSIYNRIKNKLSSVLLNPRVAIDGEKISSSDHNENMEEIYLDLNALYDAIDNLYKVTSAQYVNLASDYEKSRAAIYKLLNDVKVFALRKNNPEFNEIKLIDFNASNNNTSRTPAAEVSPNIRLLQLKPLTTNRLHLVNRANRVTKVYTKTYSPGIKGELSSNFPPERMVDQKPETFWGTLILAESPVSQIFEKTTVTGDTYQVSVDGPVVELYFKFSNIEKINTIKILPFCESPIKILDVSYRPTSSSQIFIPVGDFKEVTTLDWEELNFKSVFAAEVKITIAQENYKKVSYLLPKSVVVNTDIFQRILKQRAAEITANNIYDSDFSLYLLNTLSSYESARNTLESFYVDYGVDNSTQPNIEYFDNLNKIIQKTYSELGPVEVNEVVSTITNAENTQQPGEQNINIVKYEYLLGIREVEINYQLYYPTSYYESEKFLPQASVSEIQIEVDDRHVEFSTEWQDNYRATSIEWEVDLGAGRKIPIHPKNQVDAVDGIPCVKDERINFDITTNKAYTRLGGYYSVPYRVKKDSDLIPPEAYEAVRVTGSIPKIEIHLTGEYFNPNSIYTIDYAVDPGSYSISILDKFDSEELVIPDTYTEVGPDNDIELSKFPFINYELINLTGYFSKDETSSSWNFIPPQKDIFSGQLRVTPRIIDNVGNIVQSGIATGFLVSGVWGTQSGALPVVLSGNSSLDLGYFGDIKGVSFGYFVKPMDSTSYGELSRFLSATAFELVSPIEVTEEQCRRWASLADTNIAFSGSLESPVSGSLTIDYAIGIGVKSDNNVYAISNIAYSPISVTVGGKEAKNITNYETLIHPAFAIGSYKDKEIEFIQAGKKIYFSQKITNQEIKVYYNWLTDFIKLNATLRYNEAINPDLTPKVNSIRIFMNNLVI